MLVRTARPSGWKWDGNQVVVEYRFYITRNADATNLVKTVEDAVFPAIGVNDTYALPRTMSKEIVPARLERVEVTIVEEATAPPGHAKTTQVSDRCHACGAVLGQGGQIG